MSRHQQWWLAFCITAVVLTNSVCWAQFERISLGKLALASISWMFRRSKLRWEQLLTQSVRVVLETYGITQGAFVNVKNLKIECHNRYFTSIFSFEGKKFPAYPVVTQCQICDQYRHRHSLQHVVLIEIRPKKYRLQLKKRGIPNLQAYIHSILRAPKA